MAPVRESMKPFDSTDIDERICILQNYGLSQRNKDVELGETPVMFYDYAFDEYQKLDEYEGQIVEKKKDLWAASPATGEDRYKLNHDEYFPKRQCELGRALFLRVIDFPELRYCWTEGFLKAIRAQMKPETHNSPPDQQALEREQEQFLIETLRKLIPQAPDPAGPDIFKSGISFSALTGRESADKAASRKPPGSGSADNAFLALMVYMPYFDISTIPDRKTESLTLPEYRLLERGEPVIQYPPSGDRNKDLLVHQAWFMMLNNEIIAMFRSAEDKHSDPVMTKRRPQPLFPDQHRTGAFHALVQMISNIFTSSRKRSLNFFLEKIAKGEFDTQHRIYNNDNTVVQTLDSLVIDLITLKSIVKSQVEILEDLQDIYENTTRTPAQGNCHNKNVVKIPVLQKAVEEIPFAVVTIEAVVRERKKYQEKLDVLLERAERSKKHLSRILKMEALQYVIGTQTIHLLGATTSQTQEINEQLSKTGDSQATTAVLATEAQTIELEKQRQIVTSFTILTTLFLPLGFCASVGFRIALTALMED
ncbi:hypothetical protein Q9L58_000591 [Maublancomyces gigas]|uniref:Uncharacterized protein n=1 Tax=Discina gigas TaxID=1032678 RepID=A0ABR3GWH3_9PEZI